MTKDQELLLALRERNEARAEVERLRASVENLDALYVSRTDALRECEAALRTVAERQREACAAYLRNRMKEANEDNLSVDYVRGLRAAVVYADATPLVTEGGK